MVINKEYKYKRNKVEIIKNVFIVVLFTMTILLLYLLWGNKDLERFMEPVSENNNKEYETREVVIPEEVIINIGEGDYKLAEKKYELCNDKIISVVKKIDEMDEIRLEEISEEQYKKAFNLPSIRAIFAYHIPVNEFKKIFVIKNKMEENFGSVSQVGISQGGENCLFIKDGEKNKYFRIIAKEKIVKIVTQRKELLDKINGDEEICDLKRICESYGIENNGTYYKLKDFLGEKSKNDTMILLEEPEKALKIKYKNYLDDESSVIKENIAEKFFGRRLDFVRKIEEAEGTTIYMYGYGQKVLIISPEGFIEYKENVKDDNTNTYSMEENLREGLKFLNSRSSLKSSLQTERLVLADVKKVDSKKNSFLFSFSYVWGTEMLYGKEHYPLEIEMTGGQVSNYREETFYIEKDIRDMRKNSGILAIELISSKYKNFQNVAKSFKNDDEKNNDKKNNFEQTAEMIKKMKIGYLKNEKTKKFESVWIVELENSRFYYDLKEGNLLYQGKR